MVHNVVCGPQYTMWSTVHCVAIVHYVGSAVVFCVVQMHCVVIFGILFGSFWCVYWISFPTLLLVLMCMHACALVCTCMCTCVYVHVTAHVCYVGGQKLPTILKFICNNFDSLLYVSLKIL